jgi:uncharacterized protein YciI
MLRSIRFFPGFILSCFLFACTPSGDPQETPDANTAAITPTESAGNQYDPQLAEELGADEYGMKQYVMAFLKRGPNRDRSPEEAQALQRAHLDNIGRMAEAGQLILAGPFMDDGDIRGIYIFDVKTVEEAQALTETDPAIQAGSLIMELHPWYGSAALMKLSEIYPKLAKEEI